MIYETIVSPEIVQQNLENPHWVIIDCRFHLADPNAGFAAYQKSHIPGALYADLDKQLSNPPTTDNGRHPLPPPDKLNKLFSQWGITHQTQLIVYDDFPIRNGISARLWWMARYMGHSQVAVLDGGWQSWIEAAYPTQSGIETRSPAKFVGNPQNDWLIQHHQIEPNQSSPLLVDSRDEARYIGQFEPIDRVPGHIPGAVNYFFKANLQENGRFLTPEQLQENFSHLLADQAAEETIFYCGSGVTACHNLLALKHAGFGNGKLYVGSWSEWSQDPQRPVATKLNQTLNGKKEGLWIDYFANGQKRREGHYKNSCKDGKWTLYHKNGTIQSEATFQQGFYTGYYVSYHESGAKFREGYYADYAGNSADGFKTGTWHVYLPDGTLKSDVVYKRGRVVSRTNRL